MDYETIGRRAVAWREAENDKKAKRAIFMAAHIIAIEDHGKPCEGACYIPGGCSEDGECQRRIKVHDQTRAEYDSWIAASRAASSARGSLTRLVSSEQAKDREAADEALRASEGQGNLFGDAP